MATPLSIGLLGKSLEQWSLAGFIYGVTKLGLE